MVYEEGCNGSPLFLYNARPGSEPKAKLTGNGHVLAAHRRMQAASAA